MWDVRACKTPLFDLKGHTEQVMCVSWAQPKIIVSGGADNDMKVFKSNVSKDWKLKSNKRIAALLKKWVSDT